MAQPGDRIIFEFIPARGRCAACSAGMQNLCELGQYLGDGTQISDHTARHHARGEDIGLMCLLGCGVVTGWGSAVYAGGVKAGDTAVVVGVGGIGINAV